MTSRATVRTRHDQPEVVAAALRPDNTDEMTTRVEADGDDGTGDDGTGDDGTGTGTGTGTGVVVTTIERDSTGGLRTTVDDYVTNLAVAQRLTDTTPQS